MNLHVSERTLLIGDEVGQPGGAMYNFPSCELLSDGRLFVCARKVKDLNDSKGTSVAIVYDPATQTITPAVSPAQQDMDQFPHKGIYMCHVTELAPGHLIAVYLQIDTQEGLPLFCKEFDGLQNCTCRTTESFDNGQTWQAPKTIAYSIPDIIVPSKIQRMQNGVIGFPVETHNHYGKPFAEPCQSRLIYSTDGGKTFDRAALFPHQKDFLAGDARCTMTPDGEMILFFWGFDLKEGKDLSIFRSSCPKDRLEFEPLKPIHLAKQISCPFYIDETHFLCVYQERFSEHPGIKAMLSYDGGWNYDPATEVVLYGSSGVPDSQNPFLGFDQYKFGYTTLTRLGPNRALALFWHSNGCGTCISCCTLTAE